MVVVGGQGRRRHRAGVQLDRTGPLGNFVAADSESRGWWSALAHGRCLRRETGRIQVRGVRRPALATGCDDLGFDKARKIAFLEANEKAPLTIEEEPQCGNSSRL
jgi:hypothetical protein